MSRADGVSLRAICIVREAEIRLAHQLVPVMFSDFGGFYKGIGVLERHALHVVECPPPPLSLPSRCRANMAHIRQSSSDSGLGLAIKVRDTFQMVPSWLGSAEGTLWRAQSLSEFSDPTTSGTFR